MVQRKVCLPFAVVDIVVSFSVSSENRMQARIGGIVDKGLR
jgi:hypothetical protein